MHLSPSGLRDIISLRASMNKGLSELLSESFKDVIFYPRPVITENNKINPYWLTGFVDGEGCFYVKPTAYKAGYAINMSIS